MGRFGTLNREQPRETIRREAAKRAMHKAATLQEGARVSEATQVKGTAKVGLIVPSSQTVTEPLFYRIAPPDIAFFTSRMLLTGTSLQHLQAMEFEFDKAVDELASAEVDCLMKCCTLGGAMNDPAAEAEACEKARRRTGIPTSSTVLAVVESLSLLSVSRLVVATPYTEELDRVEEDFLEKAGFRITRMAGMGIGDGREFANVSLDDIYQFALQNWDPSADGLFLSCMNWRALLVAERLEEAIQRPVVTSHSATLWKALELAKIRVSIKAHGRLLRNEDGGVS